MFHALAIVAVFLVFAGIMMAKKLPTIIALPLMAVVIAVVAGMTPGDIFETVISKGSVKLSSAMMAAIFGGVFARMISKANIAEEIIKKAAELAGDQPLVIAFVLTAAVAVVFASLGGLGTIILTGTIVLPLMMSVGIATVVAASLMLMGVSLGGLFNVGNFLFYTDVLGVTLETVKIFALASGIITAVIMVVFIIINVRSERAAWAMPSPTDIKIDAKKELPIWALISPLLPIVLVFVFSLDVISAILISCIYVSLVTNPRDIVKDLSSSFVEGINDVSGALFLMIGIGMLLNAVMSPQSSLIMGPFIQNILPSTPVGYVIFFTLLSPLALYRGPLNMWGLGSGVANLMIASGTLSPFFIMAALRAVGTVQGVSDPTNTANVWVADYVKTDTGSILKKTILYAVVTVFLILVYTVLTHKMG
jgi:C4-dicarboxylate transporter, DcuC family